MTNLFNLLKKLFNVDNVESVTDEMVENYFDKQADVDVVDEPTDDNTDDKDDVIEEDNTDVIKEVVETEVNPVVDVVDEPTTEPVVVKEVVEVVEPIVVKEDDKEPKTKEVLTKDVINNATANNISCKENLMALRGDAFFSALHKHASNLKGLM